MAFSTQKDFLKIAFLNNRLEPVCTRKPGVKLKSYLSSTDSRSWAMNKEKQAHFLADLIACRNYAEDGDGDGLAADTKSVADGHGDQVGRPTDKDSLLELAQEKLVGIENMLMENQMLRNQLDMSHDKLAVLEAENKKIKSIATSGVDPEKLSPFHNKVRELRARGKISPQDEKDLLEMQKYLGCKDKDFKVLEAENNSLRQLVEKLAARAKVNKLPVEKETCNDVKYLQNLVNDLREEIGVLRGLEDQNAKLKVDYDAMKTKYASQKNQHPDSNSLNVIIEERNNLRDQLAKMIGIEDKIAKLRKRAAEADCLEKELKDCKRKLCCLQQGSQCAVEALNCLAKKSDCMQNESKMLEQCAAERDCLKQKLAQLECQLREANSLQEQNICLNEQVTVAQCKLQKMQFVEQELINTKKRLCRSEQALEDYECQLHQLMDVIEDLESQKCFCCCGAGGDSAEKDGHIKDLITASKLTLEQVKREFEERVKLQESLKSNVSVISGLKKEASDQFEAIKRSSNAKIDDLLKQLAKCKADNNKLKEQNSELSQKVTDSEAKINVARDSIRQSIADVGRSSPPDSSGTSADKCCEEAKMLREDLAREKALMENKLKDMTALYEKAKDDCEKSQHSSNKSAEEADALKKEKENSDGELKTLNGVLDEQKQMLASAKAELEQHRNDLNKCNEKAAALENEIGSLRNGNAELSKQLKDKENELAALNGKVDDLAAQLAACQEKLKASSDIEAGLRNQLDNLNKSMSDCNAEMNRIKNEKSGIDSALANKDNEIKAAMGSLDKCKADLEALRKQLQDKIDSLQAEKAALEKEVADNKQQLGQLEKLVKDIEAEREKNKKLEAMAQEFENQLKSMPKEVPKVSGEGGAVGQAVDQLKNQLDSEMAKVNDLASQLAKCQQALAAKGGSIADTVKAIDQDKAASLTKLQNINDNQKQAMAKDYDREIEALKIANQALRDSLTNLKQNMGGEGEGCDMAMLLETLEELKKGACKCGQRKACMTKLEKICQKIIDVGIECLDIKELTYLHSEVYKAGLRLKPELVGGENKNRCCKCTGFSCCLPSIPKDMEKKLIDRIMCLEKEVESANQLLERFKECSGKKAAVSSDRSNACRVNDEINELLKRSKEKVNGSTVTELYKKCKKNPRQKRDDSARKCN